MADHITYIDQDPSSGNLVPAAWLNDTNDSVYQGKNPSFVTSTGSANAQVVTLPASTLTALEAGQTVVFKAGYTNTAALTLEIVGASSTGAIAVQAGATALTGGEIIAGSAIAVIYNNSVWNLSSIASGALNTLIITDTLTFGPDGTIVLPDSSVTVSSLSADVLNLILSSGGGGGSNSSTSVSSGDGRLSLASGVKVMVTEYTSITTVYYVGGLLLFFNDGTDVFSPFTIGELSQTLASTTYSPAATAADKNYDLFGWKDTLTVSSITRSGAVATVTTSASHNITTDAVVFIAGAAQSEYNGYKTLTAGSGTTFTFAVSGTPATPATGTITAATARLSRGPAWRNSGQAITGATNATPIVITATSHGLSTGDSVEIANVGGNTAANGVWTVTVVDPNSFSLTGSVGNGSYFTSGAFAARGVGASTAQIEFLGSSYVNSVSITNGPAAQLGTYIGTIHTNGTNTLDWKLGSAAAGGGPAYFSVWNVSNRVEFLPTVIDSNATWTYSSSAARPMDNSTSNRISFVRGLNADSAEFTVISEVRPVQGLASGNLVGIDSTTEQAVNSQGTWGARTPTTEVDFPILARYAGAPGLGFHYAQALEYQGSPAIGPCTWFGRTTVYTVVPLYSTAFFGALSL